MAKRRAQPRRGRPLPPGATAGPVAVSAALARTDAMMMRPYPRADGQTCTIRVVWRRRGTDVGPAFAEVVRVPARWMDFRK